MRGVVNDSISIHLVGATIASAFVARWCIGHRAEAADGVFRIREDESTSESWRLTTRRHERARLTEAGRMARAG
jgi:GH24 family phage-related lysozyme (muramidase)